MDASLLTDAAFWRDAEPVVFQTSGSSGTPKSIVISKAALLISATAVNEHLAVTQASRWGLALPLHHVGGFGVAARAYAAGCGFHAFSLRWNAERFTHWLGEFCVSHTSLVPTQVHDLVRAQIAAPASLRAVVVGGGSLDTATGQAARDLGWPVLASYGMTEAASQIATQDLAALALPYRAAPLPLLPIWQASTSPEGRLSISGPALFSGWMDAGQLVPRKPGWHLTADLAALENGQITPLGRADTLVKILGELVDPAAIERELAALSCGQFPPDSFAIATVPDERAGYLLVPFFETHVDPSTVTAVLAIYGKSAPGFRRLQAPVFLENLPRSPLGKLRRAELLY